jgi:ComF family protein
LCKEQLIGGEEQICLHCLCDLHRTPFLLQNENPVIELFAGIDWIEHATAFFFFEKGTKVQKLIHSFKYGGNKKLAGQLGRQAALALQSTVYPCVDVLIPVPLHPKKERERGYNQSEWICRGLASVWNTPIRTDILQRRTYTESQTSKSMDERRLNMQNTILLKDMETLQGCHVLLVDDVITSGSTLTACADELLRIPDIRVSIFGLSVV